MTSQATKAPEQGFMARKRPRTEPQDPIEEDVETHKASSPAPTMDPMDLQMVVSDAPKDKPSSSKIKDDPPAEDIPALFSRLTTSVNPNLVNQLLKAQIIGHVRPTSERFLDARYYEIQVKNLRDAVEATLKLALINRYHEHGQFVGSTAQAEIDVAVPLTANAFMTALYAKLRTIHKQYGKYGSRYTAPASYSKDVELPLPFADAIENFGVFESKCEPTCSIYVPVYPEGTKYEGRSTEDWASYKYDCCTKLFKELGIPCKNVDPRAKAGSAWWTYKMQTSQGTFDASMILPALHYSDHSLVTATMFLQHDDEGEVLPIIKHLKDDSDYGKKGRMLRNGTQVGAFLAICNTPDEDWNAGMKLTSS